jgi:RsmE family RNA methyltransferase
VNLLLLDEAEIGADGVVILRAPDERHHHIWKVLRTAAGESLRAGVLNGGVGDAELVAKGRDQVMLQVRALDQEPPPPLPVVLVLALPRPKFLGRILQSASAMGVKEIVLLQTERVEKSFWDGSVLASGALERHLRLGLEQARDTVLPQLRLERRFGAFVAERLPLLLRSARGLIAHGEAIEPMPRSREGAVVLLVGPEGGLLDHEVKRLVAAGMRAVSLGPRPLRVETAVAVALGRLL